MLSQARLAGLIALSLDPSRPMWSVSSLRTRDSIAAGLNGVARLRLLLPVSAGVKLTHPAG
jgi:hypothetical protein